MSPIRSDECVGMPNVAGHRRPDHHVRAGFRARSRIPSRPQPRRWRGRSEAESLDGDESEPIIDDVMVRVSSARDVAPLGRDRETCSLLVLGPMTREAFSGRQLIVRRNPLRTHPPGG